MNKEYVFALARVWTCVFLVTLAIVIAWCFFPNRMLSIVSRWQLTNWAFDYIRENVIYVGSGKFYLVAYTLGALGIDRALFVNFFFAVNTIALASPLLFALGVLEIFPLSGLSSVSNRAAIFRLSTGLSLFLLALSAGLSGIWTEEGINPAMWQIACVAVSFSCVTFLYVSMPSLFMVWGFILLRSRIK